SLLYVYFSLVFFLFFFFSSRRRHTRSKRDWSSDVCSSDLYFYSLCISLLKENITFEIVTSCDVQNMHVQSIHSVDNLATTIRWRSEERRVGKECRFRWWW